jgi:uncharacterized protein (TIGR00730 family)
MGDMSKITTVCVYCGSGAGTNPRFVEAAAELGKALAENNIRLVYGGGSVGLMGAVAKSTLDHGGSVTGIIPDFLKAKENALAYVQEMIVTPDMHERKRLMFERSDAFVALPGGIGTLEEFFEVWTWRQLGYHDKPIGLLNLDGYFGPMLEFLNGSVGRGLMTDWQMDLVRVGTDVGTLLADLVQSAGMSAGAWAPSEI